LDTLFFGSIIFSNGLIKTIFKKSIEREKMISLVMTYHNRLQQTRITLRSIEHYCQNKSDLEIIIIDDASNPDQLATQAIQGINLPIRVIYIPPEKHWWINPCVPFNIGIKEAQGDIICLQTPECVHVGGDLLGYFREHVTNQNYLVASCCLSLTEISYQYPRFEEFLNISNNVELADKIVKTVSEAKNKCWCKIPYHFLSAMSRNNMNQLGGFDELFADGYAFDDDEFLFRIEESGLKVEILDPSKGFVIHQWHSKSSKYHGGCPEWNRNKERLFKLYNGKRDTSRWG